VSLDLARGPLFRVVLFQAGARPDHLLFATHDLVVDGFSWRILLADFQTAYAQLGRGLAVVLPPVGTSFMDWAERLALYGRSEAARQELEYWTRVAPGAMSPLPVDHLGGKDRRLSSDMVQVALDAEQTAALLQEVPKAYGSRIEEALVTALAQSLARWTDSRTLHLDLVAHGREEEIAPGTDLSRTVGWFTSVYPLVLDLRGPGGVGEALRLTKEKLRKIPNRGIGYGVLRYLSGEQTVAARLSARPPAEVSFNYRGQFDQVLEPPAGLRLAALLPGSARPRGARRHLIDVLGQVAGGQLIVAWSYFPEIHRRETIQQLADLFLEALRSLIHHCTSSQVVSYTPSDFPEADLSQEDLDEVIARLSQQET
jgi:non-ribosomal peptide synthase protein (TIGR01720 family)